ncbi:tyrosine-type recombinase/integrase [Lysinibacillus sp. NPDC096418]|uniref:tyrosine-type recombinase/integrase n=1 Tax=Lysinibacillus sp. NPDC096418 TaxID=3364138 RepID=UPI0037FDB498
MTLTHLQQLFSYLERDQSRISMRNELMFKLLATTGLRRSELVSLTWEQVDRKIYYLIFLLFEVLYFPSRLKQNN